ncbi:zinc ribbon domain-containing protein [Flavobacterium maritimum]|uniref:zinc ribbon domain-containing protein n=1 Tax=Flavobacterium maritimum TaxID=3149042 RepID=UPI0032B41ACB
MENKEICQSCGMPLDSEAVKGTKKNGLKSKEYCKYCYENGEFKHPKMSLEEMQNNVKNQMKKLELHDYAIQKAINILPALKRWKS